MPFIIPKKRTSVSRSTRFSRYRDVEPSPDGLLLLQERKKTKKRKPQKGPQYRIITNAYPRYEVAYGADLQTFREEEWAYCVTELPNIIPHGLSKDAVSKWLVAHFTQLAFTTDHRRVPSDRLSPDGLPPRVLGDVKSAVMSEEDSSRPSSRDMSPHDLPDRRRASVQPGALVPPGAAAAAAAAPAPSPLLSNGPAAAAVTDPTESRDDNTSSSVSEEKTPSPTIDVSHGKPASSPTARSSSGTRKRRPKSKPRKSRLMNSMPKPVKADPVVMPSVSRVKALYVVVAVALVINGLVWGVLKVQPDSLSFWLLLVNSGLALGGFTVWRTDILVSKIRSGRATPEFALPVSAEERAAALAAAQALAAKVPVAAGPPDLDRKASSSSTSSRKKAMWRNRTGTGTVKRIVVKKQPVPDDPDALTADADDEEEDVELKQFDVSNVGAASAAAPHRAKGHLEHQLTVPAPASSVGMESEDEYAYNDNDFSIMSAASSCVDTSSSESEDVDDDDDRVARGQTFTRTHLKDEEAKQKWIELDGLDFKVRHGPDYATNKMKDNSGASMYDVLDMDIFSTARKVVQMDKFIKYPTLAELSPSEQEKYKDLPIPPHLVINCAFPQYQPENPLWGSTRDDGPNWAMLLYLRLNDEGIAAIRNGTPAGKLLVHFMQNVDNKEIVDRFKCIPRVAPYSPNGLPNMLSNYNGKPFLTRPQHQYFKTDNHIEAFVDIHTFSYVARRAFYSFINDRFPNMVIDVGFVVEGRCDEELPEQVICGVRVSRLDLSSVQHFDVDA